MDQELHTLISLLDDSDSEVYTAVTNELLKQGLAVIPKLEKVWESTPDVQVQERLENIIHYIQYSSTNRKLKKWLSEGARNLIEGASYVAQLQYPGVSYESMQKEIKRMSGDVYLSSGDHLTALEKIKLLNYVFFELNNFTKNTTNLYSPQNSFINEVLQTRKGNPVSLGIIYLALAQQVGLPVYGVNLPKCFILAYVNEYRHNNDADPANDVLFYINPYNKGAILNRREVDEFIKQQKLESKHEYYVPCNNVAIIQRLVLNLIISFDKMGYAEKIDPLKNLLTDFKQFLD